MTEIDRPPPGDQDLVAALSMTDGHSPIAKRRMTPRWLTPKKLWGGITIFIILLAGIQLGSKILPPYLFPGLPEIWNGLVEIVRTNFSDIGITLLRFAVSLLLAVAGGWALGVLMGAFRNSVAALLRPLFSVMQAIPALSWVLLSVLWITGTETRIVFVCFVISLPLYAINVYEGIRNIDGELVDAIDQFRPNRWQVIRVLLIPQSFVYLLISLRSVTAFALRILIFAELIGAGSGIGQKMGLAQSNFQLDLIFAWTMVMILINFLLVGLTNLLERWLLGWRGEAVIR